MGKSRSSGFRPFLLVIRIVLLIVFLFSGYLLSDYLIELYHLKNAQREMADIYEESVWMNKENGKRELTFEQLHEINEDIVGWISIDGTSIDYPVVQARDNIYYLSHSVYKEESSAGTIFMDSRNGSSPLDKNTVLYGHHMKNGMMFHDLAFYKEAAFYKKHPYVEYGGVEGIGKWEVFSAYVTNTADNYIETQFDSDEDFEQFLERVVSKSLYHTGCEVKGADKILTLSTCSYEFDDARMVVHAKLVE